MSKQLSGQRPPAKQAQRRERRQETRRRDQVQLEAKHKRNAIIIIVATCFLIVGVVVGVMALTRTQAGCRGGRRPGDGTS